MARVGFSLALMLVGKLGSRVQDSQHSAAHLLGREDLAEQVTEDELRLIVEGVHGRRGSGHLCTSSGPTSILTWAHLGRQARAAPSTCPENQAVHLRVLTPESPAQGGPP